MRNQKILPRNNPSPAQSDRGLINVNEVIVWIRGVYGIENDGLYLDHYQRRNRCSKKDKSDHEKGNLQLITFDRNTIHAESFGLNWTRKKNWTGSMTSPLRTVRLVIYTTECLITGIAGGGLVVKTSESQFRFRPVFHRSSGLTISKLALLKKNL